MKKIFDRIKDLKVYRTVYHYIDVLLVKFDTDHIWIMSSGISFNILMCIIPFTLMLLTVLGYYLESGEVQEKLISYLNSVVPLPGQYKDRFIFELTERTKELSNNAFLTGTLGLAGLFWTVSGLFSAMREVLRKIYNVNTELNYFIGKIRDFALVIISVVLFILSMAVTSGFQIIEEYSQGIFGEIVILTFFQKLIPIVIAFLLSFGLFYVLYALVPHWRYNRKVILFSSFMSAIFFEALKYLFSVYVLKIANYGKIYGAYATIVISIFYIYYISVIFVVGAELGSIYYERNKANLDMKFKPKNT
ncbi:MAG: YihY/virulence factor BrkB family protein [Ignavibacteriae bacterium]|nr:YihY/virulence factor BrkB family protein [Ignavibacteriota bacterium]